MDVRFLLTTGDFHLTDADVMAMSLDELKMYWDRRELYIKANSTKKSG